LGAIDQYDPRRCGGPGKASFDQIAQDGDAGDGERETHQAEGEARPEAGEVEEGG